MYVLQSSINLYVYTESLLQSYAFCEPSLSLSLFLTLRTSTDVAFILFFFLVGHAQFSLVIFFYSTI